MTRIVIALGILALVACGGEDSSLPEVDAAKEAVPGAADSKKETAKSFQPDSDEAAAANPQASSCFDLVSRGRYSEAVAPCMAALRIDQAGFSLSHSSA